MTVIMITMLRGAQWNCGVSILGNIQSPARYGPEQPALVDPTLNRGLD